jgi:ATP/maltotriose-dependent transcriptional regulator MalT
VYADSLLALTQPALRAMDETADARVRASQHRLTAIALAYRGNADESIRHARRAVELIPFELDAIEGWDARNSLLEVLIVTGRLDEAVAAARELVRPPSPFSIARLKTDPLTVPLRNHPEFQRLVNR